MARHGLLPALLLPLLIACPVVEPEPEPEPVVCDFVEEPGGALVTAPWLQSMEPTSVWILWETETGRESRVDFGATDALGEAACGQLVPLNPEQPDAGTTRVHEVQLTGLQPATRYHYRVTTGDVVAPTLHFKTPAEQQAEASFRVVAMSDSQRDSGRPDQLRAVIEDGVIAYTHEQLGPDLAEELSLVLFAGDLVDSGWYHSQWVEEFFAPGAALFGHVPLYPVYGNHEGNSPHFARYFHLPANGTPGFEEHWYSVDVGNLRLVGLDSNEGYRRVEQLDWLSDTLDDACADEGLDFVFAQLHHPHRSELWTPGNIDYTGEVIALLEAFSTDCGKPSVQLFGHTHGYSRGQSRDHAHLMINVASAGGALDRWAEQPQEDYEEFSVSQDEYGFVLVEIDAGAAPQFRMRRISLGTPEEPRDNEVRDEVTIRPANDPPATPTALSVSGQDDCDADVTLQGSPFEDGDGDAFGAAHWQIATDCGDFSAPVVDRWLQHENWYMGQDSQAGDDLADEVFGELEDDTAYCWQVRYRDRALAWSDWSTPEPFTTAACAR
jgi:acid phosphatase type 7